MTYYEKNGGVFLTGCENFSVKKTLECGQVFRYGILSENKYQICAGEKMVYIEETDGKVYFYPCEKTEFQDFWLNYFDLPRDYGVINAALTKSGGVMERAVSFGGGIRILNQLPFETLISFIVSQRKNIPAIKKAVDNICAFAGRDMGGYYAFPTPEALAGLTYEDFCALKTGFRAKYLFDAAQKVYKGEVSLKKDMAQDALRGELLKIYGVGEKIADCTLLFAFGARDVFPIDVWIKRAVETFYFDGENLSINEIAAFAREKYGNCAGCAQQYLYYYARSSRRDYIFGRTAQ